MLIIVNGAQTQAPFDTIKPDEHCGGLQRRVEELYVNPEAQIWQMDELAIEQRRQLAMLQEVYRQLPFTRE